MDPLQIGLAIVCLLCAAIQLKYFYNLRGRQFYWLRRGVVHRPPSLFYGNIPRNDVQCDDTYRHALRDFYNEFKWQSQAPFGGFYIFTRPVAVVFHMDLVENILMSDFNSFSSRGGCGSAKYGCMSSNLLNLQGSEWYRIREKMTPAFVTRKLKLVYPKIVEISEGTVDLLSTKLKSDDGAGDGDGDGEVDVKATCDRFVAEIIRICAFGLTEINGEFLAMCQNALAARQQNKGVFVVRESFPKLAQLLGCKAYSNEANEYFVRIVSETIAHRELQKSIGNDFMDFLIDFKNSWLEQKLTMQEVAAQCFSFILAGFETTSSTLAFCLYELARHEHVQERARCEIKEMLRRHEGQLSLEGLEELQYVKQVLHETMRLHTAVASVSRVALRRYEVPGTKFVIEKGTEVYIPIDAIHHDPDFYVNPDVFDPTHFEPEAVRKRHPLAWLPFGTGPRNCIGLRLAEMQMLSLLSLLLQHFRFSQNSAAANNMKLNVRTL